MQYRDNEFAIRRMVGVRASKQLVYEIVHLSIGERLSHDNGCTPCNGQRKPVLDVSFHAGAFVLYAFYDVGQ